MAPRRKLRQREAQLAFETLSIEGGLLSPEWLTRVAQLAAGGQSETDYRVPKGLSLRDEISRHWRIAQAHWADFARGRGAGAPSRPLAETFVTAVLRDAFGFGSLASTPPVVLGERTFPVGHLALEGRVPVVVAVPRPPAQVGPGSALDDLDMESGDGSRRRSPFGLAQEFLNAREEALWAIVSDGLTLRLCRDNASLTRPAWIEADLARIFTEDLYADFAALWLLAHETRFGVAGRPATECPLESWRNAGREEGTRAREFLREGVEEALVAFGRGFLGHSENQALRQALHDGTLGKQELFQELLRLVYRLIFLLTVEERELLHPTGVPDAVKALYAQGYSVRRLRDRSVRRGAHDRFGDLWDALKIVLRGVAAGEPRLGLPALGGLFAPDQCLHLDNARLENRWLLTAIFRLSWLKEDSGVSRVNWRDMGPEELGSVYESLLELVPVIPPDFRGFGFATGDSGQGNARRTTGSFYTPDNLVQVLLDSALEPVVKNTIAAHPEGPVAALLALTVVDPACGSGHFLLAAARRLAVHVARVQAGGTPTPADYRHALREVVSRCLFGVDLNPMAVELCRAALWMEAVEPGLPLSFLDAHVQCGNALLGTTPALLAGGIPDAAWEATDGDDKRTANLLKKRNKAAAEGQRGLALWNASGEEEALAVQRAMAALEAAPDADLVAVTEKEAGWEELRRSPAYRHQKLVADAWCAAFVWPKPALEGTRVPPVVEAAPTNDLWRQLRDGQGVAPALTVNMVEQLASQYDFLHWHLAFPQVFARGGFDVVLGNPPYLSVQSNVIPKPVLHFLRIVFPSLQKIGDFAALFADTAMARLKRDGAFGLVLPSTILVNLSFARLRESLVQRGMVTDIVQLGDGAFPGAVVPTCLVAFTLRSNTAGETKVALREPNTGEYQRKSCVLREIALPPHYVFAVEQDERSARIIRAIHERASELREHVDIKEGIKTGDDAQFLASVPFPLLSRRVVRGRDIDRFTVRPTLYVKYDRHALSRPQRPELFEVPEKLFIRRVGTSLTAAYDSTGLLCLHTLYVARPRPGAPCRLKYLLGVLNSRLMNWLYGQLHMKKGEVFAEVRIHALNGLPVIVPSDEVQDRIVRLVERIEAGVDVDGVEAVLDAEVCAIYGVTLEQLRLENMGQGGLAGEDGVSQGKPKEKGRKAKRP